MGPRLNRTDELGETDGRRLGVADELGMTDEATAAARAGSQRLAAAVSALALDSEEGSAPRFAIAQDAIAGYLSRNWSALQLSGEDVEDLTAEVIAKLVQRVRTSGPLVHDGYVYRTARNAAVDSWRRRQLLPQQPWTEAILGTLATDDDTSARFEALQTATTVRHALGAVRLAGDRVCFLVVTSALDLTQEEGRRPSNRSLATRLGISHTAVNKALTRFRGYLDVDQDSVERDTS